LSKSFAAPWILALPASVHSEKVRAIIYSCFPKTLNAFGTGLSSVYFSIRRAASKGEMAVGIHLKVI
jgi:hypothetical protein